MLALIRRYPDLEDAYQIAVQSYDDLIELGSENAVKSAGKMRLEGKDYVMADGDVVEFRFNV